MFEILNKEEHTDPDHGRNYSAKHTVTTTYKHPKGIEFKHVHVDGRDYEDVYVYETVTVGDVTIKYSYDWGNYFIREYVKMYKDDKEVSYAEREHGAVDPLKTETKQKSNGREILAQISDDFGMNWRDFLREFAKTFKIKIELLQMFF